MCGICGKLNLNGAPIDPALLRKMTDAISHRGPDEEGVYVSGNVGLGNRRLKIIDLNSGRQPIANEDGSIWVVYNGEIYNYKELRSFLVSRGHKFQTATDTEVIVHLYEEIGENCIEKLQGMFGFALWDEKNKKLLLARDRVGIKPVYYSLTSEAFLFGSEIKSLLADPSVKAAVDTAVLDRFLTYLYTPGEESLFKGIFKLLPGHYICIRNGSVKAHQYWDLHFETNQKYENVERCARELDHLLAETVRSHMISDVPVGVLLSGGVDSTAVLSYAAEQTGKQISTFTVGFDGEEFADERPYARLAAQRFGARHFETTLTSNDFVDCLPRYVWHMEEPVCEPPAIALYYITKLARSHVTVLLSGEGGDEAFAGYQNYRNLFWLEQAKRGLGHLARPASTIAHEVARFPGFKRIQKYAPLLTVPFDRYYYSRTSDPFRLFNKLKKDLYTNDFRAQNHVNGDNPSSFVTSCLDSTSGLDTLGRMQYVDTKTWLPDDLLIKADKMTMANSLELRVPLLDHKVLEFAARLPRTYKLHLMTTKYILKRALADRVPQQILDRTKTGFPVPYERWMRREAKEFVKNVLTDRRTVQRGYFKRRALEDLVESDLNLENRSKEIFSLVILELWHRTFIDNAHLKTPNQAAN